MANNGRDRIRCIECNKYLVTRDKPKWNDICKICKDRLLKIIDRMNNEEESRICVK